jgi:Ca-activated chloride channel homolog
MQHRQAPSVTDLALDVYALSAMMNCKNGNKQPSNQRTKKEQKMFTKATQTHPQPRRQPIRAYLATSLLIGALAVSACGAPASAPASGGEAYAAPAASQEYVASEAPPAMYFADYGVNGFVDTAQDRLSTFAVDVDTGSYTLARRYLTDGILPPPEAIRPEEFVNFFDYGYANPPAQQTFGITLDAAPSPFANETATHLLRIGIQGYAIPAEKRKDAQLTFVVDVSGSMDMENRLGLVKRSLALLVEELRPSDAVALVVYGSEARLVLPMTTAAEKEVILAAIHSLQPEGSTNAEAGLRLAYAHAWESFNPQTLNRVVLASDGVANVGPTGPEAILDSIGQYAAKGITLTSVGVGMGNYNDVLMEQLADQGDGFYAYVDTDEQARRLFVHDLTGTLQTIALDAKIQVEFNPEAVARYRLIGYENRDVADDDFRDDETDAGEVGAGHSVTALYEIELHPAQQTQSAPLATVHLRWQEPESGEVVEQNQTISRGELLPSFDQSDPHFQVAVIAAGYAEVLRQSEWADGLTLDMLLSQAQRVNDLISEDEGVDAAVSELVDLIWRANQLSRQQ